MHPVASALHARVPSPQRVDRYYAPLAEACASRLARARRRPWVLGIQGPQGCGKTTLATALVEAFGDVGVRGVAVSIDDFYLTHDEQRALATRHEENPCLRYRGYPGTHDVALGVQAMETLAHLGAGEEGRVPVYDKSAHGGRGDRAAPSGWRRVVGPVELLIVEGWMLGFSPTPDPALPSDLRAPNAYLAAYAAWSERLDAFVRLDVESLETIVDWRIDAERARRDRGEAALCDADARDYVERFLPAYRVYLPRLREHPPCEDVLTIGLRGDRMPADMALR